MSGKHVLRYTCGRGSAEDRESNMTVNVGYLPCLPPVDSEDTSWCDDCWGPHYGGN